jgi:MFS transporter, DHA2 family, multidrug resistance protein
MSYELGIALGIALLGTLQTLIYRAQLPDRAPDAVVESLAAATGAGTGPALLDAARHAFAQAMQTTSTIAAVLLVVAGVIAWKLVPARPSADD